MKKVMKLFFVCLLCFCALPIYAQTYENDMRAVWISTVFNLDYPSTKNNITAQQNEFIQKLETLKDMGMNTVIVQVRPKADALYASSINPWSDVLTGQQGKNPGYDPLAFMVQAAHERGMEIHAWLNPYRVTTSGTDLNALCDSHPARLNPWWTFSYNNALYYNPEVEEVKQHIVETVKEIAVNYNVDGIHFDDYFYPSNYPLPQGETKDGTVAHARREAVNDMVKRVSRAIKTVNATYGKSIKFGISPPGIWKNNTSDISGSSTAGREAYYALFADTRTWIKNEWVDYIVPQIYWKIGHSKADYATLIEWWSNEVAGTNVKLYIGQGIYTDDVAKEIKKQLQLNKNYSAIKGSVFFSLRDLLNNRQSCKNQIMNFYMGTSGNINLPSNSDMSTGTNTDINASTNIGNITNNNTNIGNNPATNIGNGINTGNSANTNNNSSSIGNNTSNGLDNNENLWVDDSLNEIGSNTNTSSNQANGSDSQTIKDLASHIGKVGTVTASSLNVRSGAKVERDIVAKVALGSKVTILGVLNDWYKVKLSDGKVGWANSNYISVENKVQEGSSQNANTGNTVQNNTYPFNAKVTASTLNVRSGARVDREIITTLAEGSHIKVLSSLGDWYKIQLSDGKVGWASSAYITRNDSSIESNATSSIGTQVASEETFPRKGKVTASSLNIRSGAKTEREIVAVVAKDTELTILASLGDWYKVKFANGIVGWAAKSYIS